MMPGGIISRHLVYLQATMITRKIKSLKDQTLDTLVCRRQLVVGEVVTMDFINEPQLMAFVGMHVLDLVPDCEPVRKVIPVVGVRRAPDDVQKREVEAALVFQPGFDLDSHMSSGV